MTCYCKHFSKQVERSGEGCSEGVSCSTRVCRKKGHVDGVGREG